MAAPKRIVKFTIDCSTEEATIKIRRNEQRDANAAASLTEGIAKALGTILERHVGNHAHHDTMPDHDHDHHHHHA